MHMPERSRIEQAAELARAFSSTLYESYCGGTGKREGKIIKELYNVFRRSDDNLKSFGLYDDGHFCDFGDNNKEYDWLDYLQAAGYARDNKEAADIIIERFGTAPKPHAAQKTPDEWVHVKPIPKGKRLPEGFPIKQNGGSWNVENWSKIWTYTDENGDRIGYVARFETGERDSRGKPKKIFRPLIWARNRVSGEEKWKWLQFQPSSLYCRDKLASMKDIPVLLVSGEKCADTANVILSRNGWPMVATTWQKGDGGANKADWSALAGRSVIGWPDNDDSGKKAMAGISSLIGGINVLQPPADKPQGWDIADAVNEGWSDEQVLEFILKPVAANDNQPQAETLENNRYFVAEGITASDEAIFTCYYFKKNGNIIVPIRADRHNKETLSTLAPVRFFEDIVNAGRDEKLKTLEVISYAKQIMIETCCSLGNFNHDTRRARGVWEDNGKIVLHLGNRLFTDKNEIGLNELQGEYRYRACASIPFSYGHVATDSDGEALLNLCRKLPWSTESTAYLLAGWLYLAPICGLLQWRPSIWICGERGSGKSYVGTNIIVKVLRHFGVYCKGESTEAGIRQKLKGDAYPVVHDEAEGNDEERRKNINRILGLIRQSSSSGAFLVLKGTTSGSGLEYTMTTMFCMLSISPTVEQAADISRIAMLEMKVRNDRARFAELQEYANKLLTLQYSNSLVMRAINQWSVIQRTISIMSGIVSSTQFGGDARMGDQYGTLLAGAWCLKYSRPPTKNEAEIMVLQFNWDEAQTENADTDAEQCLRRLMQHKLTVRTTCGGDYYDKTMIVDTTVGGLIAKLFYRKDAKHWDDLDDDTAQHTLRDMGLWVHPQIRTRSGTFEKRLLIQNKHERLTDVFKNTPWPVNWNRVLSKLSPECYDDGNPHLFTPAGKNARALSIPEAALFGKDE